MSFMFLRLSSVNCEMRILDYKGIHILIYELFTPFSVNIFKWAMYMNMS